jgi:hypothetical protein
MSDYLFDKEGEPEPDVERLEAVLRPLAYRPRPLPLPRRRPRAVWIAAGLAAAAAIAVLVMRPWVPRAGWDAMVRDGSASVDGEARTGALRLAVGAWIETRDGRATLKVAEIGTVELGPATRARIVETGAKRHALRLERGTLAAKVDARPRAFAVETPRLVVTDLGCAFELSVDERGRGKLVVSEGSVAMSVAGGSEIVVRAGDESELGETGPSAPHPSVAPNAPQPSAPQPSAPQPSVPQPIAPKANAPAPVAPASIAPKPHAHVTPKHVAPASGKSIAPASGKPVAPAPVKPVAQPKPAQKSGTGVKLDHDAWKNIP